MDRYIYIYIGYAIMSEIAELRLLIEKEKEKGDKLDRQLMTECKLLEEAEEHTVGRVAGEKCTERKRVNRDRKTQGINIRGSFSDGE